MPSKSIIKLHDVSFAYNGERVLDGVNLDIQEGEYLGMIGPNGGGKTTVLKLMLGLLKPGEGSIELFGQPLDSFRDWPRIGYVPQRAANLDNKLPVTVEEVVSFGRVGRAGLFRRLGASDRAAVRAAMETVDVLALRHRLITELSGGQQQRVFIAKALASEPQVLILDEPTVGVDVQSQDAFYQLLTKLNQQEGLTLVMVSHDIDVIVGEATRLACVNKTIVYHGAPKPFLTEENMAKLYGKTRKLILHGH